MIGEFVTESLWNTARKALRPGYFRVMARKAVHGRDPDAREEAIQWARKMEVECRTTVCPLMPDVPDSFRSWIPIE